MAETAIKFFAFLFTVYALIPTALARIFHFGVLCRAPGRTKQVAITFDDGPDPKYTPRVLRILAEFKVKACFFILGKKAKIYPELVSRIQKEGHEIASHGYHHSIHWLQGPRSIKKELKMSAELINEITGRPPRLYRPPWGLFNLYSFLHYLIKKQQVVLWSFMSWDWGKRSTPESIARKVLSRAKGGSILVFHDSDDTPGSSPGTPDKMLGALPIILTEFKKCCLEIKPLSELLPEKPPKKNLLQLFWHRVEKIIRYLAHIEDITEDGKPAMFRLALKKYKGKVLPLPDGTSLHKGDFIGELHINNEILENMTSTSNPFLMGLSARQAASDSLKILARWLAKNPRYQNIKAVLGLSLLHRGSRSLGFQTYQVSSFMYHLARWYEIWLLIIFHPAGRKHATKYFKKLKPKYLAMSKSELFKRYLN